MKINYNILEKRKFKFYLILIFFSCVNMQSQCILSDDDNNQMAEAKVIFKKPNNYFCVNPLDSYFSIHPDFFQGQFSVCIINEDNKIMIGIFTMPYPKSEGKINKYLIANVDMNHISKKALAQEMDIRLSKMNLVGSSYLKKINADRGYVYNLKVRKGGYLGIYPRCKKVQFYKDNVGRAEILFFYKYGQDALVKQEIEKTWGMLKFKS
jgi:hypothetical protein